jgi:WD40 repeat protein/endonuclease YncB( thermonuclease family)
MTAGGDRAVRLWDLRAADPSAKAREVGRYDAAWKTLQGVALSPNNRWLVTVGGDRALRLWDLKARGEAPRHRVLLVRQGGYWHRTPDGRWLTTGSSGGRVGVWDLAAEDPAATARVRQSRDKGYAGPQGISPDGRWLVGVSPVRRLWDLRAKDPWARSVAAFGGTDQVRSLDFSADSRWLATGGDDGRTRLYDLAAADPGKKPLLLTGHPAGDSVREVVFSPNGRWLVTGSDDQTARVWDRKAADPSARSFVLKGHTNPVSFLAVSPDSRWLLTGAADVSGFDRTARLWGLGSADPAAARATLGGLGGGPREAVFGPDGRWLVTRSSDKTARLWDLKPVREGQPPSGVTKEWVAGKARQPGGRRLRITGKVKVRDASTLVFADGTEVTVAGTMDAPDLGQKALLGGSFYPCGKEAAAFLTKLVGGRPVTFYAFGAGEDRLGKKLRGVCFVGETCLGTEMVRNGWALAVHSGLTPYEVMARENRRGLWRGKFVVPERWRKGERLPGE